MERMLLYLFVFAVSWSVSAQNTGGVRGIVVDAQTQAPLSAVEIRVEGTVFKMVTDIEGAFSFAQVIAGNYILHIETIDYLPQDFPIQIEGGKVLDLETILLEKNPIQDITDNLITLTENDFTGDGSSASDATSGLLQASRDVFLNTAAFDFGQAFYRVRGYDTQEGGLLINGVQMNRMFNGRPQWNNWGGLNDVMRNQEFSNGLALSSYAFGGLLGTTNISTRASNYRPGFRLSASASNRTYAGRLMGTYSSGLMKDKWAFTISASRRWADEGYVDATIYDAFSVFGAVEYRINKDHSLNFTAMYTPNRRGSSTSITREVFDILGRKRYNPNWGYQNGEQRNSRIRKIKEPIFMLSHYLEKENLSINTNITYQTGEFGISRIANQNAPNPSPVFYRYLPSFYLNQPGGPDLENAELARQRFIEDPQLDWEFLYRSNLREGGDGRSVYVLYQDRTDDTQFLINSILNYEINENLQFDAGLNFRNLKSENFAFLTDLLGGTFYTDIDPFSNTPNDVGGDPIKRVGDRFLYNYEIDANQFGMFSQIRYNYSKFDFFASAGYTYTGYQREGLFLNGQFLDNSLGKGEKLSFNNFGIKGGVTFRATGRHIFAINGAYITKPPTIRNAFANARANNDIVPNLPSEKVASIDGSYIIRTPSIKGRLTGYYTQFQDATEVNFFFLEGLALGTNQDFVSESVVGIDKLHFGGELGLEWQVTSAFKARGVASFGQYTFTNNPNVHIGSDEIPVTDLGESTLKDYRISSGPQQAYSLGLEYRGPNYWWVGVTGNFLSHNYVDVSAVVRTDNFFINPDDPDGFPFPEATEEEARELLKQERLEDFFLMNLIGGKSWRVKGYYISLFASVNNLLDRTFRTGGFEQARRANFRELAEDNANGTPSFGPRHFYGFGLTYFINLALSF